MFEAFAGNRDWSIQALRIIAESQFGGGDFSECLDAMDRMTSGDVESWTAEWQRSADKTAAIAAAAAEAGHDISAYQAFFRAFNYYRMAESFLAPSDMRKLKLYSQGAAAFQAGTRHFPGVIEQVSVPFEDTSMPGYFCPAEDSTPGPAVLLLGGADSWAEELYFLGGNQIVARGMHLLILDTPGRGALIRLKGVLARHDYEMPVGAAIDYLSERPEVDPDRIGLVGDSMGGYYAPRAAALDDRVRACVAWSGCYDVIRDIYDFYPPIQPQLRWIVGADSDDEARQRLSLFTMDGVAQQITCPLLVIHGASDFIMSPAGAEELYEQATGPKELRLWGAEGRGGVHLSYDDISVVLPFMFDWLYDALV